MRLRKQTDQREENSSFPVLFCDIGNVGYWRTLCIRCNQCSFGRIDFGIQCSDVSLGKLDAEYKSIFCRTEFTDVL